MEKPVSQFGLLNDAKNVLAKAERNVNLAASNVYNLRVAAEAGELGKIAPAELVRILKETEEALKAVAN